MRNSAKEMIAWGGLSPTGHFQRWMYCAAESAAKRLKIMLSGFAAIALLSLQPAVEHKLDFQSRQGPIMLGWNDEFNSSSQWHSLEVDNRVGVAEGKGKVKLVLGPVPKDWPWQYQWSGLQQDIRIDISRYSYLLAKVDDIYGYAHLDIEVLNAEKKPVKSFRTSTLQKAGISFIDLSSQLDPAVYSLRIRLIVGGANTGCSATYDWIRFTSSADGPFLQAHPDYSAVAPISRGS